jgi:hypothetical protein
MNDQRTRTWKRTLKLGAPEPFAPFIAPLGAIRIPRMFGS